MLFGPAHEFWAPINVSCSSLFNAVLCSVRFVFSYIRSPFSHQKMNVLGRPHQESSTESWCFEDGDHDNGFKQLIISRCDSDYHYHYGRLFPPSWSLYRWTDSVALWPADLKNYCRDSHSSIYCVILDETSLIFRRLICRNFTAYLWQSKRHMTENAVYVRKFRWRNPLLRLHRVYSFVAHVHFDFRSQKPALTFSSVEKQLSSSHTFSSFVGTLGPSYSHSVLWFHFGSIPETNSFKLIPVHLKNKVFPASPFYDSPNFRARWPSCVQVLRTVFFFGRVCSIQ